MHKIVPILIAGLVLTACSVLRRSHLEESSEVPEQNGNEIINSLVSKNLSINNFYIQKAEVELTKDGEKEKFIASWKYEIPGISLISIRTRTGIEVVRVYLTADTLLVNDRINRILYYGKPDYIAKNFGIPQDFLPLLIGDYIKGAGNVPGAIRCSAGMANFNTSIKGIRTEYIIDCRKGKLEGTDLYNGVNQKAVELRFKDFVMREEGISASKILIKYYDMNAEMSIEISKIEYPWEGKINFIPGRGYDIQRLN